jgi:hypothetical protein
MKTKCPNCDQKYSIDADMVGSKTTCQNCGTDFTLKEIPAEFPKMVGSSQSTTIHEIYEDRSKSLSKPPIFPLILIILGITDIGLAIWGDFNITGWMGSLSPYSGWISVATGLLILTIRRHSKTKCPVSNTGEPNILEISAYDISASLTASDVVFDIRGDSAAKFIPNPPPKGVASIRLDMISNCTIHKEKGITQGLVITLVNQQKFGLRIGSSAKILSEYIEKAKSGIPFKFERVDTNKKTLSWVNYFAIGWTLITILGLAIPLLADSPLKPKTHAKISDWNQIVFLDTEKYRDCVRGAINQGTPFRLYGKVNFATEEENVYQCDLVVKGYEGFFNSDDFFAACPQKLAEGDYFEATAFFDQVVSFETILEQNRSIPKIDIVEVNVKSEAEILNAIASLGGKDFSFVLRGSPAEFSIPKSFGLVAIKKETIENNPDSELITIFNEDESNGLIFLNIGYGPKTRDQKKAFAKTIAKEILASINEDLKSSEEIELDNLKSLILAGQDGVQCDISNWGDTSGQILLIYHEGGSLLMAAIGEEDWVKDSAKHLKAEVSKAVFAPWAYDEIEESEDLPPIAKDDDANTPKNGTFDKEMEDAPKDVGEMPHDGNASDISNLAELKLALSEVEAEIASERERFQEALGVINRLTNFKRTPVKEGSPAYYQCLEASKIIKEVEAGAPALKEKKAQIEALISKAER